MVTHPAQPTGGKWVRMREVPGTKAKPKGVSEGTANARRLARRIRNDHLVDWWSASHFVWAAALTLVVGPWWGLALMLVWEPFEILLLGPLLSRKGIAFGHETWRNAASDAIFDAAGVAFGYFVVLKLWDPMGII